MSLTRRIIAVSLALVLALVSVGTVAAEPGDRPGKEEKGLNSAGTPVPKIAPQGIKAATKELKLYVPAGRRHNVVGMLSSKSTESFTLDIKGVAVVIAVNDKTRFKVPGKKDATLADIPVGGRVAVHGARDGSTIIALTVHLIPGKPQRIHRVGEITALSSTSITIANKKGEESTFSLSSQTTYLPAGATPVVGDTVTVVANRIPSEQTRWASAIVLHKPRQNP